MAKEHIAFTIDHDVLERIRAMAEAHNRNLSNMVETLLKQALDINR